jgi:hypothetical protein
VIVLASTGALEAIVMPTAMPVTDRPSVIFLNKLIVIPS